MTTSNHDGPFDPDRGMTVAAAQIAPVFLDREATLERVVARVREAGERGVRVVAFGEALVPGYPIWLERTGGAVFDSPVQKDLHARYLREGVSIERGDLSSVQAAAAETGTWVVLGCMERPASRAGHTLYASAVTIAGDGRIASVHRKLMPTYDERLCWAPGDGHGLVVHDVEAFRLGSLNCWENWIPLARAALHAQGETLHCAIWPGSVHNTEGITRFAAREGRSYVVSASSILRPEDLPDDVPHRGAILEGIAPGTFIQNGGSAIAGPDGSWIVEPRADFEGLLTAEIDPVAVRRERQNFDHSGHYGRPEILGLTVDRTRRSAARFSGGD